MGKFSYDDKYLQFFFQLRLYIHLRCVYFCRGIVSNLWEIGREESQDEWETITLENVKDFFSLFDDAAVASSILLPLQISNHYYVKNGKSLKKSSNYILSMEKMTWSVDHIILLFSIVRIFLITWITNLQILEFWHALSSCLAEMKQVECW